METLEDSSNEELKYGERSPGTEESVDDKNTSKQTSTDGVEPLIDSSKITVKKYHTEQIELLKAKYTSKEPSNKELIDYSKISINGSIYKDNIKPTNETPKKISKLKKKSKKIKNMPDPDVANISDLLSCSLLIESPEKGLSTNDSSENNISGKNKMKVDSSKISPKSNNITLSPKSNDSNSRDSVQDNISVENDSESNSLNLKSKMNSNWRNIRERTSKREKESIVDSKSKISKSKDDKNKKKISENFKEKQDKSTNKDVSKKVEFRTDQNIQISPASANINNEERNETPKEKRNAFQFMMDSRNKSIGTNSPGKDKTEENDNLIELSEKKGKLKNRKLFLEEWSDKKGGTKRKLEEEAKDKCIEKKLSKRAKRMKEMLSLVKVLIDSESSNDSVQSFSHELKENTTKNIKKNVKENKIEVKENKIEVKENEIEVKENKNEVIEKKVEYKENKIDHKQQDTKENDRIFTSPPTKTTQKDSKILSKEKSTDKHDKLLVSPSLKKTSLLNYFDVSNKQNCSMEESPKETKTKVNVLRSTDNIEPTELIKVKLNFTPKKTKNKNKSVVDENLSLSNKSKKIKKKHRQSLSLRKTDKEDKTIEPKKPEFSDEKSNSPDPELSPILSSKTKKNTENSENAKTPISKKLPDSKQFTPRTWRMKVKLFEKGEVVDDEEKIKPKSDSDEDIIIYDDEIFPNRKEKNTPILTNLNKIHSESLTNSEPKKDMKIAPLFMMQSRKSDIIAANAAKKKFLYSGVPQKMKKILKQKSVNGVEDFELTLFPKISHIQQREDRTAMDFWDLPNTSLILPEMNKKDFDLSLETMKIGSFTECKNITNIPELPKKLRVSANMLPNIKILIKELKKTSSNYPVYKVFRLLRQKCGTRFTLPIQKPIEEKKVEKVEEKPVKKKRGRPKKKKEIVDDNSEIIDLVTDDITPSQKTELSTAAVTIWTDKYKPISSEDIIGNSTSVNELKNWLQIWVDYSIEQRTTNKKRKRLNSNSSDDFCSDSDTRDTDIVPQNTMILIGPCGSGKTSTVYALCNELNINVIELHASSKRPGKKILLDLQEATKSHQVKNTDTNSVNSFFQKSTSQDSNSNSNSQDESKKLSLLLVEDADIVFDDQDEGFINALATLISSSKRPIIITTSDENCAHLQKFLAQHKVIIFNPLNSKMLGTWLEILCLVEGIRVNKTEVSRLLEWNKGDMRKTLLQLQFWVQSGGDQLKKSNKKTSSKTKPLSLRRFSTEIDVGYADESSNLSWMSNEESSTSTDSEDIDKIHNTCVDCFVPYCMKDKQEFQLPFPVNLGNIWWNTRNILGTKPAEQISESKPLLKDALDSNIQFSDSPILFNTQESLPANKKTDLNELRALGDMLDSIAFADVVYTQMKLDSDSEPTPDYWKIRPIDSLSFQENMSTYRGSDLSSLELTQWLVENNIKHYRDISNNKLVDIDFNLATPINEEKRGRKKQHAGMEGIMEPVPASSQIDRRALCVDYHPTLRCISRSEQSRSICSSKRNNRFYHYLRGLNVKLTDSMYEVVCNTLLNYES